MVLLVLNKGIKLLKHLSVILLLLIFIVFIVSLVWRHSPRINVLSLPKEHFDIFKYLIPKEEKHGFKFSKLSLFILLPLIFKYSILFIN